MGHGIAQIMAMAGCQVRGFDESEAARQSLPDRVRGNLLQMEAVGIVEEGSTRSTLDRITVCESESDALQNAEFVTEAVAEDLATKQELFARIESFVQGDAILASNTSSYPMSDISLQMPSSGAGGRHPLVQPPAHRPCRGSGSREEYLA